MSWEHQTIDNTLRLRKEFFPQVLAFVQETDPGITNIKEALNEYFDFFVKDKETGDYFQLDPGESWSDLNFLESCAAWFTGHYIYYTPCGDPYVIRLRFEFGKLLTDDCRVIKFDQGPDYLETGDD